MSLRIQALLIFSGYVHEDNPNLPDDNITDLKLWLRDNGGLLIGNSNCQFRISLLDGARLKVS